MEFSCREVSPTCIPCQCPTMPTALYPEIGTEQPQDIDYNCHLEPHVHKFASDPDDVMVFHVGKNDLMYGNAMQCSKSFSCPAESASIEFMLAEIDIEGSVDCEYDFIEFNFDSGSFKLCGGGVCDYYTEE